MEKWTEYGFDIVKCALEWFDDNDGIWKERMSVNPNEIEWLLNGDWWWLWWDWKERMSVNHNKADWLLNRIDDNDVIWKERTTVNHNEIEW